MVATAAVAEVVSSCGHLMADRPLPQDDTLGVSAFIFHTWPYEDPEQLELVEGPTLADRIAKTQGAAPSVGQRQSLDMR